MSDQAEGKAREEAQIEKAQKAAAVPKNKGASGDGESRKVLYRLCSAPHRTELRHSARCTTLRPSTRHCTTVHCCAPCGMDCGTSLRLQCMEPHCASLLCSAQRCTEPNRSAPQCTAPHATHCVSSYSTARRCQGHGHHTAWLSTARHCTAQHSTTQAGQAPQDTAQHGTILYRTAAATHCPATHSTAQHRTVPHCIAMYRTAPLVQARAR